MESRSCNQPGESTKCQDQAKAAPRGVAENIARLDELRRVDRRDRARLFLRAVPTTEYLLLLSQAGILSARGQRETDCYLIAETGEPVCNSQPGNPHLDCRQSWCPASALNRMRLITRLGAAYAHERKALGVGL